MKARMSGRASLNSKAAEHLAKLLGRLGSDYDVEVIAAGRAADRFVRQHSLQWADIITASPEWQTLPLICRAHAHMLSAHERDFVDNSKLRRPPSDRQVAWLTAPLERLQMREPAA
jgi:ubiquinone biosynthesis protein UbiJ